MSNLTEKYSNGIYLGCFNSEELASMMAQIMDSEIVITSKGVEVKERGLKVNFFVENQRVYADYPMERIGFSSFAIRINGYKRIKKMKKAVLLNEIMDRLASAYQPLELVTEDGNREKAIKISDKMKYSYLSILIMIALFVFAFAWNNDNEKVRLVKSTRPEAFPSKTYGVAFKDFFDKPDWKFFEADNGEEVVEFTGYIKGKERNKENKFQVQFIISSKGKSFELGAVKLGDEEQNDLAKIIMIGIIFAGRDNVLNNLGGKDPESVINEAVEEELKIAEEETKKYYEERRKKRDVEIEEGIKKIEEEMKKDEDKRRKILEDTPVLRKAENNTEIVERNSESEDYLSQFILPESDRRYLTEEVFNLNNVGTLRFARNEIYARHGRMFKSEDLKSYFNSMSWYQPLIEPDSFNENVLNEFEKANLQLIKEMEKYVPDGEFRPVLKPEDRNTAGDNSEATMEPSVKYTVINQDIGYNVLLENNEIGLPLYLEGKVWLVYDYYFYVIDSYGNKYKIHDRRNNKTVVLNNSYVRIYGNYLGASNEGDVIPEIEWIE